MSFQKAPRCLLGLMLLALLGSGCSSQTRTPAPTDPPPTATLRALILTVPVEPTERPSSTPTPSPMQVAQEDFEALQQEIQAIQTLCLDVQVSYLTAEPYGEYRVDVASTAQRILTELGLQLAAVGDACDATLRFALTCEAHSKSYRVQYGASRTSRYVDCYTGGEIVGEMTLNLSGHEPLTLPIGEEKSCPPSISKCPGADEAPIYSDFLPGIVLNGLALAWGPEVLVHGLEDTQQPVRSHASGMLGALEPEQAAELVPLIVQLLERDAFPYVIDAVSALGAIGPPAMEAVPALIQTLDDPQEDVRQEAAMALGKIGPPAMEAVPALVRTLEDQAQTVRREAATALGKIGLPATEAVPALVRTLEDPARSVRCEAAVALGKIGPAAMEAVPALVQTLEDQEPTVRAEAAIALGQIGPPAMGAVPALIQTLEDPTSYVALQAATALGSITGQDYGKDAAAWQVWWEQQQ